MLCFLFGHKWVRRVVDKDIDNQSLALMSRANNIYMECSRCGQTMNLFD